MTALKPLGALLSLVLAACSTLPDGGAQAPSAYTAYPAAIADAAVAAPHKVLPLLPLPADETVRVVSWVSARKTPCAGAAMPCPLTIGEQPLWVTLGGEVQGRCRAWNLHGDALRRRLEQLLGLPLDPPTQYRKSVFVELRVARARVERPCLGVDVSDPARPVCTLVAQPTSPAPLRAFVAQQMADSYVVDGPQGPGYPFTRLGYTYDWAPSASTDHYGASEFIISPQSTADAVSAQASDDYCRAQ